MLLDTCFPHRADHSGFKPSRIAPIYRHRAGGIGETLVALARCQIRAAFDDRHQFPTQTATRDATTRGCRARLRANLLHELKGNIRAAIPTAEVVNNMSNCAANSTARLFIVGLTCHASTNRCRYVAAEAFPRSSQTLLQLLDDGSGRLLHHLAFHTRQVSRDQGRGHCPQTTKIAVIVVAGRWSWGPRQRTDAARPAFPRE